MQVWPSVDGSHGVRLVARGDIARGAEITISYIDSNERVNVRERRAELAEYGFVCACAKCVREAGGGKPKEGEEQRKKKKKGKGKGEKDEASAVKRKRTQ